MPPKLSTKIDPSPKAEINLFHLPTFLPVPMALPLLQAVFVYVIVDGVIFCVVIVLTLNTVTVAVSVVEGEVFEGVG